MDLEILKKRISSYRTSGGKLTRVPDDLLVDILLAWEQWTGPASGFYTALGADHRKMSKSIYKEQFLNKVLSRGKEIELLEKHRRSM